MGRLTTVGTMTEAVAVMADGDPGATMVLEEILDIGKRVGVMQVGVDHLRAIDDLGWYGATITDIYVHTCGDDMATFMSHVRRQSGLDKAYPFMD